MDKNFKSSTKKNKKSKNHMDMLGTTCNGRPPKNLAQMLIEKYMFTKNPISPTRYLSNLGILKQRFLSWCSKDKELKEAWDFSKQVYGCEREEKMERGKLPVQAFLYMQPYYDCDYKAREQERAMLRNQEVPATQVVVLSDWAKPKIERSEDG